MCVIFRQHSQRTIRLIPYIILRSLNVAVSRLHLSRWMNTESCNPGSENAPASGEYIAMI